MNVSILLEHINKLTPFNHAFEDDSVGLLIGDESNQVENLTVGHELEAVSYTHLTLPTTG